MEREKDSSFMKSNSASTCIKLGYKLYAQNFFNIFRGTWFVGLLYALMCGALCVLMTNGFFKFLILAAQSPEQTFTGIQQQVGVIVAGFLAVIVGGLLEVTFYSTGFAMLHDHKATGKISRPLKNICINKAFTWRTIKALAASLVVLLALSAITIVVSIVVVSLIPSHHLLVMFIMLLLYAILLVTLWMPLSYPLIKYILTPELHLLGSIRTYFRSGWSHLGFIFAIALSSCIILVISQTVITLPCNILSLSIYQSVTGSMAGDATGLPSYFMLITAVTGFLAGFIQIYMRMATLFPFYYMVGSIDSQERERQHYREETLNDSDIETSRKK